VDEILSIKDNPLHNLALAFVQAEFLFLRSSGSPFIWLIFRMWVVQKAQSFNSSDYVVKKSTSCSAIVIRSTASLPSFSVFRSQHVWNRVLAKVMHVQIFVKNTVNASNLKSFFHWYLLNTLLVTSRNIVDTLHVFIICRSWEYPTELIIIWHSHGHQKTFIPLANLFSSLLP
jgi:hypothetical protein